MPQPVLFLVYLFELHILTNEEVPAVLCLSSAALLCMDLGIDHDLLRRPKELGDLIAWKFYCVSLGLVLLSDICIMCAIRIKYNIIWFWSILLKGWPWLWNSESRCWDSNIYRSWVPPFVEKMAGGYRSRKKDMKTHYHLTGRSSRKMDSHCTYAL